MCIIIDWARGNSALTVVTFIKLTLLWFWISGIFTGAAYSALKIPDPKPTPLILQSFIKMKNHSLFLGMLTYTVHVLVLVVMIIFHSAPYSGYPLHKAKDISFAYHVFLLNEWFSTECHYSAFTDHPDTHPDDENQSGGRTKTIDFNIFKSYQLRGLFSNPANQMSSTKQWNLNFFFLMIMRL